MSEEHKVKAVLNIGGEISSTLKGALGAVTGGISKIGTTANKAIKGELGKSIKDAQTEIKGLNAQLKQTGADAVKIGTAIQAAQAKLGNAKGSAELYHSLGSAASKFAVGLATVAAEATAAGWAMFHLTEKYEDYKNSIRTGGLKNDMTPQNYARLNYATGGIKDPEKMEAVMKSRRLFDKAYGKKAFVSGLHQIGLSQKDIKGLTLTDAFFKVGDAIKAYKGDRLKLVQDMMGKGGADSLPFLMRGSKANRERMAEADKMGLAPTDEDIQKSKEYAGVMLRMEGSILGVKLALGQALLPAMERLGETMSDFMVKHHDEFAGWANKIGSTIERNMPSMEQLDHVAHQIGSAFEFAENHTTLVKIALGALVTIPFLPFISALVTVGGALKAIGGFGGTGGLISVATMSLGQLAATAVPIAVLGVQLGIVAKGIQSVYDIASKWDETKGILGDSGAWKAYARGVVGNDPILGRIFGKGPKAEGQVTPEEIEATRNAKKYPAASPSGPPSPLHGPRAGGNNVTINVHPSPGMDERALARMVAFHFDRALTGGGALFDGHYA